MVKSQSPQQDFRVVQRRSLRGDKYFTLVSNRMPRINDRWMQSVVYIYENKASAEKGNRSGGSGFFIGVNSSATDMVHVYAVTNRHTIETIYGMTYSDFSIRYTLRLDSGVAIRSVSRDEWEIHPEGDDVAVCYIDSVKYESNFCWIFSEVAITTEFALERHVGPGEDLFMLGRFLGHDGGARNCPSVRFGNLSMNPEPMMHDGRVQTSYLAEMRSISGYSGSPVFLQLPLDSYRIFANGRPRTIDDADLVASQGIRLLGVDCGHFIQREEKPITDQFGKSHIIRVNSGMSIVIPAWRIMDIVNCKRFLEARELLDSTLVANSQEMIREE